MRKKFLILTVLILTLVMLAACSGNGGTNMQQQGENAMRSAKDFAENTVDNVGNGVENGIRAINGNGNVDTSKFIGEAKAKEIALKKAQLSNEEVTFQKVELDHDDGIWQYEVEFKHGKTEYDADVKAEDGGILKWDVDYQD